MPSYSSLVLIFSLKLDSSMCSSQRAPTLHAPQDLEAWERLDDVIMGGSSSSGLTALEDGSGAAWKGDLVVEVGVGG
jgi:hypothetical protein